MTTRHLVDPEILPVIDLMDVGEFTRENLPEMRRKMAARFAGLPEPELAPREYAAPGRDGAPNAMVLVYDPPGTTGARAALLHMHGGGMIGGSAAASKMRHSELALAKGIVIVSVEYRLAPETPFPGPQEDGYAALAWLFANAGALNVDPQRIALTGESAGGGLAAAVALMARDRGEFSPCAQILTFPMLDHRIGGPHDPYKNPTAGEFIWPPHKNQFGWACLRGDYGVDDARAAWFSPALARNLSNLPPTWIGVGALDLFIDENLDYARRLGAAGVPVELHVYPGAIHGFTVHPTARVSQQFTADYRGAIDRLLAL